MRRFVDAGVVSILPFPGASVLKIGSRRAN
jgi:hypothetical protein